VLAEPLKLKGAAPDSGTRLAVPPASPEERSGVEQASAGHDGFGGEHDGFEKDATPRDDHTDALALDSDGRKREPGARLRLYAPRAVISVAARAGGDEPWTPLAEFEFTLEQETAAVITEPGFARRGLRLDWSGEPRIRAAAHFAPDYSPLDPELDVDRIRELFVTAWNAWTAKGPVSDVTVKDVDFGYSRLRLDDIGWSAPHLMISYAEPGLKITNRADRPLMYETRSPFSAWGGPYVLAPGKTHVFKVASSIEYRQHTGRSQTYTIPVGAQCEYRFPPSGGEPSLFQIRQR